MAYGNLYDFAYYDVLFNDYYEFWIQERDYGGSSTELLCGKDPLVIYQQTSSDDIFDPIKGSKATVTVVDQTGFAFKDLFTYDMKKYKLVVHKNSVLYWQGWILTQTYEEPYKQPPYYVKIVFVDGLGSLKNYDYLDSDGNIYEGYSSLRTILYRCYNKIGLDYSCYRSLDIYEDSQVPADTTSPLSTLYLRNSRYYTYKNNQVKAKNCYEVVSEILETFLCEIRQNLGILQIRRIGQLKAAYIRRLYDNDDNLSSWGSYDPIVTNTVNDTARASLIRTVGNNMNIYPAIGELKTLVDYGRRESILENYKFLSYTVYALDTRFYHPVEWSRSANMPYYDSFCHDNFIGLKMYGVTSTNWNNLRYIWQSKEVTGTDDYIILEIESEIHLFDMLGRDDYATVKEFRMQIALDTGATTYTLSDAGKWEVSSNRIDINADELNGFKIQSETFPDSGTLYLTIYQVYINSGTTLPYILLKNLKMVIYSEDNNYELEDLVNTTPIDENNPNKKELELTINDAPDYDNSNLQYDNAIFTDTSGPILSNLWDIRGGNNPCSLWFLITEMYASHRQYSLEKISTTIYTKLIDFCSIIQDKDNSNNLYVPLRMKHNTKMGSWDVEMIQLPVSWAIEEETGDEDLIILEDESDYIGL